MNKRLEQAYANPLQQLTEWVDGVSRHNTTRDECCPDFSCCLPQLQWPVQMRVKFAAGSPIERYRLTLDALAQLQRVATATGKRLNSDVWSVTALGYKIPDAPNQKELLQ